MYYFQVGLTIFAVISMVSLAAFMPFMGSRLAMGKITPAKAMQNSFLYTLFCWFIMLFSVVVWKAEEHWDTTIWVFIVIVCFSLALIIALVSALAFLRWIK